MRFWKFMATTAVGVVVGLGAAQAETTLTIATVNNPDMVVMQKYSAEYEAEKGVKLNWLVLDENTLRQRVTTDIATNGGQFDIITIGAYETPIWGKAGWLVPFDDLPADYDAEDMLPTVRDALSYEGKLYSVPFYAESAMTFYRKDLFEKAGLTMPDQPTWQQIADFAAKLDDKDNDIHGICVRGLPGWGENLALVGLMANVFGGVQFDMDWHSAVNSDNWKEAVQFYVDLANNYGPPGVVGNGFNENLALMSEGKCAMWNDATVAAGFLFDPKRSKVADKLGLAQMPIEKWNKGGAWLWAWALGVPSSSQQVDEAKAFIEWATSKGYIDMIGEKEGWVTIPPGTRKSTYENQNYLDAAPFAKPTLAAIENASLVDNTMEPKPYAGINFPLIPEMQAINNYLGQQVAAALTGKMSVSDALDDAAANADRVLQKAGYYK
ncbi:MAG: sugar ABC transporter substrate-binding protein [Bauldia sp.]|uniref:ABC transporter substrate-binding protein n=1 Tax=Bauldia sp. TaxID=2575872 RepID=UPI001E001DA7|nr:sugar ABC transporter substrate-binding protein [Bauldia sp.]MCB1497325.1 sugar ABC transporter substrate-binding protein [Bauldia sp.]